MVLRKSTENIKFHHKIWPRPWGRKSSNIFCLNLKQKIKVNVGLICCDMSQNDTIGKIELNPSFVLSSDETNCKNDIQ